MPFRVVHPHCPAKDDDGRDIPGRFFVAQRCYNGEFFADSQPAKEYALIARYTRPAMGRIWTEENKYRMWLEVEATASEVLADAGIVPPSAARAIRAYGEVDVARIQEIEAPDIDRSTRLLAKHIGPLAKLIVKRASEQASDLEHFYRLVAEGITGEADRAAFLREVRRGH